VSREERTLPRSPEAERAAVVVSYGGGTDSTALLVEAHNRGIRPDLIVWADTGSEHPRTYAYIDTIDEWLCAVQWPEVTRTRWIRQDGRWVPLHEACEANKDLPSAAYGFAGCSSQWKRQPLDRLIGGHPIVTAALANRRTVERWVGYSADEDHRVGRLPLDDGFRWKAPLHEWGIGRAEARQIITCAGLPLPGKSSCWLCPHSRPAEVQALRVEHPKLYMRAIAIEAGAELTTVKGLGRTWRWSEVPESMFAPRMTDLEELPCQCST
jgi:hypothetical protein